MRRSLLVMWLSGAFVVLGASNLTPFPVPCEVQAQEPVTATKVSGAPKVPERVTAAVGEDVILTIEVSGDDTFGMAPGFPPADCTFFEGAFRGGKKQFLVRPKKAGTFYVTFWSKGETSYSQTIIDSTGGVKPPPGPVEPPPCPVTPPVQAGPYYFVVIRPDGPAPPDFAAYMANPGWKDLAAKGHQYKDKTLSEAAQLGITMPSGTTLPCVVTLKVVGNGSTVVRGAIPLPAPADIAKLAEGVK